MEVSYSASPTGSGDNEVRCVSHQAQLLAQARCSVSVRPGSAHSGRAGLLEGEVGAQFWVQFGRTFHAGCLMAAE